MQHPKTGGLGRGGDQQIGMHHGAVMHAALGSELLVDLKRSLPLLGPDRAIRQGGELTAQGSELANVARADHPPVEHRSSAATAATPTAEFPQADASHERRVVVAQERPSVEIPAEFAVGGDDRGPRSKLSFSLVRARRRPRAWCGVHSDTPMSARSAGDAAAALHIVVSPSLASRNGKLLRR